MGSDQGYSGVVTSGAVMWDMNDFDRMSDYGVGLIMGGIGLLIILVE